MNKSILLGFFLITFLLSTICFCDGVNNPKPRPISNEYVPVYVMMPLDTITNDHQIKDYNKIHGWLQQLKDAGTDGIMIDVWWGLIQKDGPNSYNWSGYLELFELCYKLGLKVQAVMSFHQCGTNVGDTCYIPIPQWVRDVAQKQGNWDIFYTDQQGWRDQECLSLGVDNVRIFNQGSKTAVDLYADFFQAFRDKFRYLMSHTINTIEVGLGPAGEMRYPSYPLQEGKWEFPGVGQFMAWDKYMLNDFINKSTIAGHPEWKNPPTDAGNYKSNPWETLFFKDGMKSQYGKFFLKWYEERLLKHAADVLKQAHLKFSNTGVHIASKVAGIHWWYMHESHAAELTAGYYNIWGYDGYKNIANLFKSLNTELAFTCFEMHDSEQTKGDCGPEELVNQIRDDGFSTGVRFSAENALTCLDDWHYDQVVYQSYRHGRAIDSFTYLRLGDDLMSYDNFNRFKSFLWRMHHIGNEWHHVKRKIHSNENGGLRCLNLARRQK